MNRSRTRTPKALIGTWKHVAYSASSEHVISQAATPNDVTSESMEDVVTPLFHKRISRGDVVNNPCAYTVRRQSGGGGTYRAVNMADPSQGFHSDGDGSLSAAYWQQWGKIEPIYPSCSDGADLAKLRALANIDTTPYEFMEDMFEIRETIKFLRNPLHGLLKLSKAFKKDVSKLSLGDATKQAKAFANLWLEYRFAVSPLVRSAYGIADAMSHPIPQRPKRRSARGFAKDSNRGAWSPFYYPFTFDCKNSIESEWKASILYEVDNPLLNRGESMGLRFKDIPETLWAIVPYSFMVDRVANISDSIRGLTNLLDPSVKILAGSVVEKTNRKFSVRVISQNNPSYAVSIDADVFNDDSFQYIRTVWEPTASDTLPPIHVGGLVKDVTSTADLLSLILANFRVPDKFFRI